VRINKKLINECAFVLEVKVKFEWQAMFS